MNRRLTPFSLALIVLSFLSISAVTQAQGPTVIVRVDLNRQTDFENFKGLDIKPFCRIGNVFFAETDRSRLSAARQANIPYDIIDDQPFSGQYYFSTVETIVSRKVPAGDLERLTEVGEFAFYKAAQPIDRAEYRRYGFEPIEVQKREIPLTYFSTGDATVNSKVTAADPILDALIAAVDQDSIYAVNTRLEDFRTRLSLSDSSIVARDWIKAKFESFGYTDVSLDPFWIDDNRYGQSGTTYNIVCIKEGTADPDKVIVIGGHWDSIVYDGNDPYIYAPGSDDDGSGTAATIEMARLLFSLPCKKTIIFVPFGAEENGLNGSWHFAEDAYYSGMDIELMINMDMIGYTEDSYPNIECSYLAASRPYSELMAQMALEYTWLYPEVYGAGSGSDHWSFYQWGFNIANTIESDFNFPGWHTDLDLTSRMDFPYLTEVAKMCLATLYISANYPSAIYNAVAHDVGDGQSLLVDWTPIGGVDIVGYRVYWGTTSGSYPYSTDVPGASSSQALIPGLVDGQQYYLAVVAVDTDDNESYLRPEITGIPRLIPLPPASSSADPDLWQIALAWQPNQELDFDHYNIYRGTEPGVYSLLIGNYADTAYTDLAVLSGVEYYYVITAVDADLNESGYSAMVSSVAATFDQGILIVDATPPAAGNPSTEEKEAFFNVVFGGQPTGYYYYDPVSEDLSKSIIGQYETVFWFDDGNAAGYWKDDDLDKLRWFLNYNTNVILAGWRVALEFADIGVPKVLSAGNLLYDYVGVNYVDEVTDKDFVGALGEAPFPNVAIDPNKVYPSWQGKMGWIGVLGINSINNKIYTFDSYSGDHSGKIVGARRDNGTNKFVFLSMPFYFLEETDAQALMSEILDWFGTIPECDCSRFGDLNLDGNINPVDVVLMVNYVYLGIGTLPPVSSCYQGELAKNGDWNCDGAINPVDVVFMVRNVYLGGSGPCDPCQCDPYPGNCP